MGCCRVPACAALLACACHVHVMFLSAAVTALAGCYCMRGVSLCACNIILPYASAETEGCLYSCVGGACDPMAMAGIPLEPQLSWLSGRYLIMSF
jgi:hypothetical protein